MKPIHPHVGDFFRIRPKYDRGGYPIIQVIGRGSDRTLLVLDCLADGLIVTPDRPRSFPDHQSLLKKYWKQMKPVAALPPEQETRT